MGWCLVTGGGAAVAGSVSIVSAEVRQARFIHLVIQDRVLSVRGILRELAAFIETRFTPVRWKVVILRSWNHKFKKIKKNTERINNNFFPGKQIWKRLTDKLMNADLELFQVQVENCKLQSEN